MERAEKKPHKSRKRQFENLKEDTVLEDLTQIMKCLLRQRV
jgi:hypothetical protein